MPRLSLERVRQTHSASTPPGHRAVACVAKRVRPALTPLDGRGGGDRDAPPAAPSTSAAPSTDWTALALGGDDGAGALDTADFASAINGLATTAARSILAGSADALAPGSAWHADVSALGDYCTRLARRRSGATAATPADPATDPFQGALLAFLLLEVAAGRWPTPQADALVGPFREAAVRLHGLLENSGWKLVRPEDAEDDEDEEEGG
jgi:hypothetical protein